MAFWIRVEPTEASWVLRKNRHFITPTLLLLPPSYMEEEPGGGEDVPQRGVAATATATGGLWLGALSRLSSAPTVGGNTCAGRRMQ